MFAKFRNFIRAILGREPSKNEIESAQFENGVISMQVDSEVKEVRISDMVHYENPLTSNVTPQYFRDPIAPAEFVRELIEDLIRRRADRQRFYRRKKSQARNWRKWRN